jgi:hypothetical protein
MPRDGSGTLFWEWLAANARNVSTAEVASTASTILRERSERESSEDGLSEALAATELQPPLPTCAFCAGRQSGGSSARAAFPFSIYEGGQQSGEARAQAASADPQLGCDALC